MIGILHGGQLRHDYLVNKFLEMGEEVLEVKNLKTRKSNMDLNLYEQARIQSEIDFFEDYNLIARKKDKLATVYAENFNDSRLIQETTKYKVDHWITFGCPILSTDWFATYPNKIIGIHLGLSPYYRGSGSNVFAIAKNNFSALGFTIMKLNEGINTGEVIHQARGEVKIGDSIQSIGNRIIKSMTKFLINNSGTQLLNEVSYRIDLSAGKLYLRKELTEEILAIANENLNYNNLRNYLANKEQEDKKFPIFFSELKNE